MRQMLYFTAPWCGPCKMLAPLMDELAKDYEIKKVNVDYDPELQHKYDIRSIPTTILFVDGVEVERKVGAQPKSYYIQALSGK